MGPWGAGSNASSVPCLCGDGVAVAVVGGSVMGRVNLTLHLSSLDIFIILELTHPPFLCSSFLVSISLCLYLRGLRGCACALTPPEGVRGRYFIPNLTLSLNLTQIGNPNPNMKP